MNALELELSSILWASGLPKEPPRGFVKIHIVPRLDHENVLAGSDLTRPRWIPVVGVHVVWQQVITRAEHDVAVRALSLPGNPVVLRDAR